MAACGLSYVSYEQLSRLKFLPSPYAGDLKAKYDKARDAFPSLLCFALHYCVYTPRNNYFVRAEVVTGAKYQRTSATKNGSLRAFPARQRFLLLPVSSCRSIEGLLGASEDVSAGASIAGMRSRAPATNRRISDNS